MKIGILTEIVNSASGARAPLEIAKYLAYRGHDVRVYATNNEVEAVTKYNLERAGVSVVLVSKPAVPLGKLFVFLKLFFILMRNKPEIFTFSGRPPFFFSGWATGVPVVRIYQGTQFDAILEYSAPEKQVPIWKKILNMVGNFYIYLVDLSSFRLSSEVVAISNFSKVEGEHLYRRNVLKTIYHGTTTFRTNRTFTEKRKDLVFLSVSRLTPYKGFHLLIKALQKVKTKRKLTLIIAGSQPKKKYLEYLKKLSNNKVVVKIHIGLSDKMLTQLYQQAYGYLTADRFLYFGMPIVEAGSFGVPTIAYDFAAAKEIVVHGKTGYVAKDESEFVFFVEKMLSQNHRNNLGAQAKKYIEKSFSWKSTAKQYEEVFQDILAKNN